MPPRLGRLGHQVLLVLALSVVIPLALSAITFQRGLGRVLEAYVQENVARTARTHATDLDLFLERQRDLLRGIPIAQPLGATLAAALRSDPHLIALALLEPAGEMVASAGSLAPWALSACRRLAGDPARVMTHAGEGHAHEVVVAVPRAGGSLCATVSFTLHQRLLSDRVRSMAGGVAYIVDRRGTVVCHAFEEGEPHVGRGEQLGGQVAAAAAGGHPWAGVIDGETGPAYAAFAPATSLPWGVWVEVPRSVTTRPLRATLGQGVLLAATFAALALGVGVLLLRRLLGPIAVVAEAAGRVADGEWGADLPAAGDDEVATLTREFNRMRRSLASAWRELDQRVRDRTRALQEAREFSDLLLDSLPDRVVLFDADLRVLRLNQAARAAWSEAVLGRPCSAIHPGCTPDAPRCASARARDTDGIVEEERRAEGPHGPEVLRVRAVRLADGTRGVIEVARDVTALHRLQERLLHQEKLAATGALAAGVAHEIGNPLSSISSELELLEAAWDPEDARAALPVLRAQVDRIGRLLRELSDLARPPRLAPAMVDLGEILDEVARLLQRDPRRGDARVLVEVDPATPALRTARDPLVQILVNLGINALAALEGAGRLTLRAAPAREGGALLEVEDDGPGIPEDAESRVFDPFFTARPDGTGLGLYVSARLAEALGGVLELVRARPGARLRLTLPANLQEETP